MPAQIDCAKQLYFSSWKKQPTNMDNTKTYLDKSNIEQQKTFDFLAYTNNSIFITGKAGTGKTTFVKRIQKGINKKFLVLVLTDIAAFKVRG